MLGGKHAHPPPRGTPLAGGAGAGGCQCATTPARGAVRAGVTYARGGMAEKFTEGPELTGAIPGSEPRPLTRLGTTRDFYDYDAQYIRDDTR